jgi:hypothetical protein
LDVRTFGNTNVAGNAMRQTTLIIIATLWTLASHACDCRNLTFSEEVAQADQIFIGRALKKETSDYRAYYLFYISKIFKGHKNDTLTIETGLGGPDCGMIFEVGKTYLVYSAYKQTSRCRRNALENNNADIVKLKYLFDSSFSNYIGKTTSPVLTANEAIYFNSDLLTQRKDFDFHGKKVAFVLNSSFIDKAQYFKNWSGNKIVNNLIILTNEEKKKAKGYDAIIVLWRKQGVSKSFRKRLIKRVR